MVLLMTLTPFLAQRSVADFPAGRDRGIAESAFKNREVHDPSLLFSFEVGTLVHFRMADGAADADSECHPIAFIYVVRVDEIAACRIPAANHVRISFPP